MSEMLLDRESDAPTPEGYLLIISEVGFLQHAVDYTALLHVRGVSLCAWAETFFKARSILYRDTQSPIRELMAVCPRLTSEQARIIYERMESIFFLLRRPLAIAELLETLFPNRLWSERPSRQHAAEWLLWLYEYKPDASVLPLLETICDQWLLLVGVSEQIVYKAQNFDAALRVLDGWLGISEQPQLTRYGEFPSSIPTSVKIRARSVWKRHLIETAGHFFVQIADRTLPLPMKQIAAKETADYYKAHPEQLTEDSFQLLSRYLSTDEQNDLRHWLQPTPPSEPPTTAPAILQWFKQEYLPFRLWQSTYNIDSGVEVIQKVTRQFAYWYLDNYPRALVGNEMRPYLSFIRSSVLASSASNATTLLVVLDGLHVADAKHLQLTLQDKATRLTLVADDLVFAPLPTITRFCKEALLRGVQPDQVGQVLPFGDILPERESPVERLKQATPGKLYIWRVLEPDHTYHKRNTYDTLRRAVEGELQTIAMNIADIVTQVPDNVILRIVITTDHGRLLADSARTQSAPIGMEVHGRTAWGGTRRSFPESGYLVEGNIAFLHHNRFGLIEDTAIILDESAFPTSDGKGGSEHFPHGGLFPEEVIIPWVVYERDAVQPEVEIRISGRGQAGNPGVFEVHSINFGDVRVTLQTLHIIINETKENIIHLDWQLESRMSETRNAELSHWPTSFDIKAMHSFARMQLANGLLFDVAAKIEIQSEEMYQREDILEGLDL